MIIVSALVQPIRSNSSHSHSVETDYSAHHLCSIGHVTQAWHE